MSTTKEKAVAAAMEAAKSGASFRESVNIGKAVMNGGSSGNSSSGGGSTPAASNGRTSGGYAHQSYKDKQAEIQRRNKKSYLDAALNIDNTVHGELLKDAVAADKKAKEEAAKHDNSAGWQQYRDNVNNPSLEYAEGLMEEYRNASDKENEAYGKKKLAENNNPTEAALVGFLYDDEIAAAQKERESAAQRLAEIGIGTNGTQIYADDFYKDYFDGKANQAKESGASTEHDPTNYISGGTGSIDSAKKTSDWATSDEVQMYNHLVAQDKKNGTNHAEVYKRYMEGVLNRRQAGARADEIRSMGKGSGKDLLMGWEAMKAGASGAMNDLGATLRGVPQGPTVSEYTAQELRQDLVDQGRGTMLFDAAQSIGAMAPGIAAGAINPLLGTAVFGTTSGASAYQDKLAEGWNKQDAMAYGVLTGASEAALEKVLGGISALGGRSGGIITGLTGKINNAIAKAVLNGAGRAFSEGSEEAIQTFIEPAIESIVRGVDYEAPGADEVIYNAIMGAITSAVLGVPEFAGDVASGGQQASVSPNSTANQSAIDGDSILGATSLGDILAVAQSRTDMDKASAKIRSDEAMLNELQQTVGRPLSGNNDIKSAVLELQTKAAVEQKLSAAVAEGTPQAIEKALMEIASNPRELNILNKYYGNLPGTVEGNIDFAKKVVNGQTAAKSTEAAAPAKVDEGQEVRDIIDQMAGIAPVAKEATESPYKAQEVSGEQVTPDATQEAEQAASERLNQQESNESLSFDTLAMLYPELISKKESETAIDVFVDDAHVDSDAVELSADDMSEYAVAKRQAEKDYGAMMEKWYAQHPEQTSPPLGHYLADETKWVKDRTKVILKKLHGDKYTDEYFDRLDSIEQKNSILGNINMSLEEKVAALKEAGIPGEWFVDNGRVVNAETQGKKIKTRDEIIEDIINDVVPGENPHNPKQRPLKLSMHEEPSANIGVTRTAEHDAADKELAARLDAERVRKDRYKIKPIKEWHGKQEAIDVYPSLNEIESGAVEIDSDAERQRRIDDAVKLAQEDVSPEQFRNATGFIKYANGNIVDPTTGTIVWSPYDRNIVDAKRNLPQDNGNRTEDQRVSSGTVQKSTKFNRRAIDSDNKHAGNTGAGGSVIELGSDDSSYRIPRRANERSGNIGSVATQPAPSRSLPTDDAELTALQMDNELKAANEEARYQETRYADKRDVRSSGEYTQQQRDAERETQRQREQEGLPKYDVAHEYGSDTVAKFSDFDGRIGNLVDEQRVFKDGKSEGTKESKSVSRLNNGKEILNMARDVMRGDLSIQDFANEYYAIKNSASGYLYTEDIAEAFQEAVRDVSPTRNTDYTQVTQGKKAKDITTAMQMLVHRAEKAAEYKIVSSNLSKQIRNNKSKASSIALGRYFDVQATPDTFFKAIGGFDRNVNTEAYALADEALENNATEKRERSAGYSFFTDVTKHKDFDAFAKNSLMSGYTVNNVELTAQEAVSLLHSLRSIREQTNDYLEGSPDTISVDRDGKTVTIFSVSGKAKNRSNALKNLEEEIESHVTGIAKEYSDALDKMFAHYSPKFLNAIKDSTGLDREAAPEGKYFPLFYRDGSDGATFNIAEALQSRFEKLGFAKERTGPGSALQIAPAAQVADNYIEQVSHYIGWASFSNKLNMLNSNIDGTGSFLSTISDVYSPKTAKLMADYIRDVGGYKTADSDNFMNQLLGKFAGAVITGRPSTAFSQLSSVYAAGGIIKPEAIRQAGVVFPAKRKHVNLDDGLLADRARHGMNDSTISEITRNADSKIKNAIEKIPGGKTYLNLVGIADAYTTKQLYAACWCDVRMDYPDIQRSNPKLFDTLVEDKFMEAVLFSQSDSDRINNAAIYRSNNYWYRATSLFTGQPNKQLNMVMTALGEYNAAKGTAKKEAAKTLANTVRGQAGAAVSYAVLKTVANLILHKWYDLKDEDDELSVKEIGEAVLSESISTMFGMLRFGEWATDRLMHLITDGNLGNDFDFQINGISQMFGLAENAMNILGIANGNVPTVKEIKDFAVSVSNVTGAPLQGAYDFANMLSLWGIDIYNAVVKGEKPKGNYDITKVIDRKISADRELNVRLTGKTGLGNTIDALTGNAPTTERQGAQDALLSLYEETREDSALPPEFSGKINDDIKLTGDEKEEYQDNLLNLFYGNFEAVYATDLYKDADTETKQAIVSAIKEFSTDQAKQEYYKAVGIEKESEYKTLLEGKDVPGHLEDGSPKPDIEAISIKDIPEYLANKVIYAQAQDKEDFDAIDDFINNFENMPDNYKQQLTNSYSEINTLIEAKNEFNVDSENFYSVKDSIADKAKEYDETAENAKSKMSGIYNANVDDGIKDSMAEMLLSKDSYAFYMAAKSTDSGDPASLFANITFNDNEINQAEAKIAVQNDPKLEELMRAWWKNKGYKTSWEKKKVTAEEWDEYYNKYH